ncbi:hypothetical protein HIO71_14680 [Chryseobacterium aquaticum]|jgi:hypothetical protein|uniref:YcxB-like protein domain-containing protein n=1 Tax=Chryseobacterium aquaticum TaxID=452084 RepID=A0A848NA44_9FLAO|nr:MULTISPECIES: hypothetical protein [Chryseobacterium]NMR35430.1 hypothetical protein [Chryseobacterium aquaticum]NRQ47506.1 hypothetical protein [Chryseobacterium sp. C-204]
MENSLKVFINFDEKITRKQLENYFYYSWKKKLPSLFRNLVFVILFLVIIDSIFKADRSRIDFLNFLGYFSLVLCFIYVGIFYFNKLNYTSKINQHIAELKKFNPVLELIFHENSFYIKSEQYDIRSIWEKVTYSISDKTILICIDMGTPFTFLLSEEETEQYEDVLNFLKIKSKFKK